MSDLSHIIEQIKARVLLSDYIKRDVELIRKGREFVGNCPFHLEKTGSFFVNDEMGSYYCFGCKTSGDIIQYITKKDGITFYQALCKLSELTGISLPDNKIKENYSIDYDILQLALEFFQSKLNNIYKYCEERGINAELSEKFCLGFSPDNKELYNYLSKYKEIDILKSGLFIKKNNEYIPRFRNRLIFPIFDTKNRVIAFGGRAIDNSIPKYLNSPETELFHKKSTIFALNIAKKNIYQNKYFIVVEGYIDVITLHKYGFNNAVGTMGTSFSGDHLERLWKYSDEIIFCFDGDNAGFNGMSLVAQNALEWLRPGKILRFCILPNTYDPDSYLQKYGEQGMREKLNNSINLIDFLWGHYINEFNKIEKIPEKIALWETKIYNKLAKIQNNIIKSLYKCEFNRRFFKLLARNLNIEAKKQYIPYLYNEPYLNENLLLYILIMRPTIIQSVIENLSQISFSTSDLNKLRDDMIGNNELYYTKNSSIINKIKEKYSKIYKIEEYTDKQLIIDWLYIFDKLVSVPMEEKEINIAMQECEKNTTNDNWNRLKALKMYSLYKRRK